jgi:hypothetical protein
MNDPVSIRFVNEAVRPMAEQLRALSHDLSDVLTTWHNGIGAVMTADMLAAIEDGREAEGVSRLTCNDVVGLMAQITAINNVLTGVGVASVIAKPCVRVMR